MRRTSLRELHINTSAIVQEVLEGEVIVIERRGVPVAEIRPFSASRAGKRFPHNEAFFSRLPTMCTDAGRLLEEDRS